MAGRDVVMVARQRDEVAALNSMARSAAAAAGRVTGPVITMSGRDFQRGDRVVCLANHRDRTITNGLRGEIVDVDALTGRFTLRTATDKRVTINSKTYDDVDYGYALTVHKAQGMTADLALVVGSDAMHRELAYTGMSRAGRAVAITRSTMLRSATFSARATGQGRSSRWRSGSPRPGAAVAGRTRRSTTRKAAAAETLLRFPPPLWRTRGNVGSRVGARRPPE